MTVKDLARHQDGSWDLMKDIRERHLVRRFGRLKLHKLRQIAIGGTIIGKGNRYLTMVLDLRSGAVVFVGESKGAEALEPFRLRFRGPKVRFEVVATDGRRPISVPYSPCLRPLPSYQTL
jgi:hypothetical protein